MERVPMLPEAGPRTPAEGRSRGQPSLRRVMTGLSDAVIAGIERARQRRALLRLDERMLRDIGLSRYDVIREAEKRFWQR